MSDTPTIVIGTTTTILVPPRSPTVRLELIQALPGDGQPTPVRVAAAAVGLCWPASPDRPKARYSGDVAGYGLAVADELVERGATYPDLLTAGVACLQAIALRPLPGVGLAREAARPFDGPPPEVTPQA